ncbi:TIGR01620 family protein [Marivivens niveibacter]|uniref:TIGR01620 family protein n=1 Tax=Marivivens niveibacter TaxID=1930667 RepID=A0A251X2F5_9RHOB|nr:TIGR01620 family protein [Marivivens niveibacter]OUD10353.1 TIGR01620 family protein [Marivivens niveibacter]
MTKGPVLIDLDQPAPNPSDAPMIEDQPVGQPVAMQQLAALSQRKPSRVAKWFWSILTATIGFVVSLAAWDYVNALIDRSTILGGIITALFAAMVFVLAIVALRELAAFGRMRKVDHIHKLAQEATANHDLKQARKVVDQLQSLYARRDDLEWGRRRLKEQEKDVFDADGLLGVAETTLLAPLDARAQKEIEAASRQVATVTAIVPLALADLFTALASNLRMIRRIAEIYGGRSGTLGSWRLVRSVLAHLVATGAVAVGDDLIGSVAGGSALSKVSRRFGEGVINGALTARVGVAALEVCRPLPFNTQAKPSVTGIVRRALIGLFGGAKG